MCTTPIILHAGGLATNTIYTLRPASSGLTGPVGTISWSGQSVVNINLEFSGDPELHSAWPLFCIQRPGCAAALLDDEWQNQYFPLGPDPIPNVFAFENRTVLLPAHADRASRR